MNESEVANNLVASRIFLSFSELEGFGLPPVEAALCANYVIGYTGEAGKEYWVPPLFDEVHSGDIRNFTSRILSRVDSLELEPDSFDQIDTHVRNLADNYSLENEIDGLQQLARKILTFF